MIRVGAMALSQPVPLFGCVTPGPMDQYDESAALSDRETEWLLRILDGAVRVRRRSHFFLWAQGQLQSLLPHDVLLCALDPGRQRNVVVDHFAGRPVGEAELQSLFSPEGGLVARVTRAWADLGQQPLLIQAERASPNPHRQFETLLRQHGFASVAAHGAPVVEGFPTTCFLFCREATPLPRRYAYLLELLMPQLHVAYLRAGAHPLEDTPRSMAIEPVVTDREIEILLWIRDGKNNQEIAGILGISPLTVKNHVQKILKKLSVQNRAQAVAKSISLNLIRSAADPTHG